MLLCIILFLMKSSHKNSWRKLAFPKNLIKICKVKFFNSTNAKVDWPNGEVRQVRMVSMWFAGRE